MNARDRMYRGHVRQQRACQADCDSLSLTADSRDPAHGPASSGGTLAGTYRDNLNLALIRSFESTVPVTTSPSSTYRLRFGA